MEQPRTVKTALVTGAARGIGAAIATHLATRGIRVAIHFRASDQAARQVKHACDAQGSPATLVQGDLSDAGQAARVCDEAEASLGGIDLLVNNIGNYIRADVLELSPEQFRDQLESNLYTTFFCCRRVIPRMQIRKFGRVINIGYAGTQQSVCNRMTVSYNIAKTGVYNLTRALAAAAAQDGVTVNCLGMGVMENSIRKPPGLPAGRTGSFVDICNAVDFLLRPESSYVNGAQLDISGGWLPEQIL